MDCQMDKASYTVNSCYNWFKGTTNYICYRQIAVIANIETKENLLRGLRIASVVVGFPNVMLLASPLEQG